MIATYLKKYVRNELDKKIEYQKTKVQSIKDQLRSLTPYHHAIDAIVLAHFKSRGYIQLLEDLTKINQSKLKLKRQKITQEQFASLSQEIIEALEGAAQPKKTSILEFFPISNLKNIIEQRIPIQLEKSEKEPDWDQEEKKEIKEVIVEVKKVLTESEYYERVKDQRGNIHYPYVSYTLDHKVKKEFIASEQSGYRAATGKLILPDVCEKLRKDEKIDLSKNISLSKLVEKVGLAKLNHENDDKSAKLKNIELLRKKGKNLDSELVNLVGLPLIYTGTESASVSSINIVGIVYDNKENLQTIYPEQGDKIIKVSNAVNRREKENQENKKNGKEFSRGKKRTNPPGIHGSKRKRYSAYALQNIEKQKIRFLYGLKEKQLYNLFGKSKNKKGDVGDNLMISCESRLDNVVFRSGIVHTRRLARQWVSHGHFLVDGQKVKIPSYQVKPDQVISLRRKEMAENKLLKNSLEQNIKVPPYINFDKKKLIITYLRYPASEEFNKGINTDLVVE
ncbi:1069_t:CDS:2 [Ambispora leptoticha]|uniref:1069_t:CDS:1 n=1 Tax=Ambispora leptoticha TaxID=144679 RepID=A0A9N8Z025_9GLOM|nr:1069_t:CDS:2 [Ambispora leptoticha]